MNILAVISLFLLISACQPQAKPVTDDHNEEVPSRHKLLNEENDKFEAALGWLDSETILYSVKQDENQPPQLKVFNRKTGKQEIFYQPEAAIVNVSISPSRNYVLVHTSSSPHKANIDILKQDGTKEYSVAIPSDELDFSWNPYEDGILFLTSFSEDWSFTSYVLDTKKKAIAPLDFPQPFAQWAGKEELLYVDWKKEDPDLRAPLISLNIKNQKKETVMLDVVHFQKIKNGLMAIQVESEKPDQAEYKFYNGKKEQVSSFSVPHVNTFSDSMIPFYSFDDKKNTFYTFTPESAFTGDPYQGTFKLIEYNWETGKKKEVLKEMENAPLSCSSEGSWCLYGHQLESVINMQEKKVYPLLKARNDE
ncbi:hypothetical protein [Bacillus sp. V59.32b]|uniref:YqgU-like beta propeller domain-containing protein n=1 Tax=Bacillus sp. V59.32b TaxID=1758642 RepID=UPI00135BDD3A|nr:hypothetical protein [Bacillus sp. V59.32b]